MGESMLQKKHIDPEFLLRVFAAPGKQRFGPQIHALRAHFTARAANSVSSTDVPTFFGAQPGRIDAAARRGAGEASPQPLAAPAGSEAARAKPGFVADFDGK